MSNPPEQAEAEVRPKKIPVCKVDATFSGVEEFPLFWERFSLNCDINVANGHWTTDAEQAQQFARLLKGDAFKHYVSLPSTIKQDINGLYDVFKAKYDAPSSEYTYRQQLHDLKRISSELLSEFAYRVENLVNKAYPHSDEKNIRIIDAFVAGVDQKLAKKYYEAEGKKPDGSSMTLRELIAFFERFERIWNIPHESNESQACGTQSASTLPSQMAEITHQISALQAQVGRLSNRGRGNSGRGRNFQQQTNRRRPPRQRECFYCHSTSHFWSNCAIRLRENPSWQPQQGQYRSNQPQQWSNNPPQQGSYNRSPYVRGAPTQQISRGKLPF